MMSEQDEKELRILKPPKNYRWVDRRVCANCKHWIVRPSRWQCERDPDNLSGDWNALEPEYHTCDRWVKQERE